MSKSKPKPPSGHKLFAAFLAKHDIGPVDAGAALDVSHAAIISWCDSTIPKRPYREAIAKWTRDEVPVSSWDNAAERSIVDRVIPFEPVATSADAPKAA